MSSATDSPVLLSISVINRSYTAVPNGNSTPVLKQRSVVARTAVRAVTRLAQTYGMLTLANLDSPVHKSLQNCDM